MNDIQIKNELNEKAMARNIYERYIVGENVSIDELQLLLRFEKSQLAQARISQQNAKMALAASQFEQINHKDHSLGGWITKGLLSINATKSQIKYSTIDNHISKLKNLIKELEKRLKEAEEDAKLFAKLAES